MLTPIGDESEIVNFQKKIDDLFSREKYQTIPIIIGYPSGSFRATVYYSSTLNIWWFFHKNEKNTFINLFGIGKPVEGRNNNIVVQINYPAQGINRSYAGMLAKNHANGVFLLHDGGIGGGRKGIGKSLFFEKYQGEREIIKFKKKENKFAVIGQINSDRFVNQVADFVHQVVEIKAFANQSKQMAVEQKNQPQDGSTQPRAFNPEFSGQRKSYNLPDTIVANADHGLVVNALEVELKKLGYSVSNNQQIDLFIFNSSNSIEAIFEIKTGLSYQTVYTAIGQLMLHSLPLTRVPKRYFVAPSDIKAALVNDLKELGINVITYRWENQSPVFDNLSFSI